MQNIYDSWQGPLRKGTSSRADWPAYSIWLICEIGSPTQFHNWRVPIRHFANQPARPIWPLRWQPSLTSTYRRVIIRLNSVWNVKAVLAAFNQEKAPTLSSTCQVVAPWHSTGRQHAASPDTCDTGSGHQPPTIRSGPFQKIKLVPDRMSRPLVTISRWPSWLCVGQLWVAGWN